MLPVSTQEEDFSTVSNAGGSKFEFEEGAYPAKCTELEKTTSKKGDEMFVFTFLGTGGPATGNTYKQYLINTPTAGWKLEQTLAVYGIVPVPAVDATGNPILGADGKQAKRLPISKSKIIGVPVELQLFPEEKDSGKVFMTIAEVLPGGPASNGPLAF